MLNVKNQKIKRIIVGAVAIEIDKNLRGRN